MAAPFKTRSKVLLEKDCEFAIGIRSGKVLELRPEGYFVFWGEWTDPTTGECHASDAGIISYEAIATENKLGTLHVLRRPLAAPRDPKSVRRSERNADEIARQRLKKSFVLAIDEMIDQGELRPVRDDFCNKIVAIVAAGTQRHREYLAARSMRNAKRGGAKIPPDPQLEKASNFEKGFKSGHTMWKWYRQWKARGDDALFDSYRNCGGHARYDETIDRLIDRALDRLWDLERPTVKFFVECVQAEIDAENEHRERKAVPEGKLRRPGYDYIAGKVHALAPVDHALRRLGWDKAYNDMHGLGLGTVAHRALERVEVDEYTIDLFVLMQATGLFDHLPLSIQRIIGLDGSSARVTISAAIDVYTRCLLALQIVPVGAESPLAQTIEMIYMDKSPIADAAGARFDWPMSGAPEAIVLDRGSKYITDEAYDILASLGITNIGAPAGKPWLKPFIERLFRTIHTDLLLRFSGRAFSNVVERGENDAQGRATLTLEAFLGWLVRWTVDAYHTKPHAALGMSPAQAWKKARKECTPRSLTSAEMREAFGARSRRKASRKGLRTHYLDYQSDALMDMVLKQHQEEFEILRWGGDIGAISVRADNGPWFTVPACDPAWLGKTDAELRAWLAERAEGSDEERRARRDFILDASAESYRLKRLTGLISLPRTADDLDRDVARFSRFTDTAERRHAAGPYRDLFDDLDEGTDASEAQGSRSPDSHSGPDAADDTDQGSME